MSDSLPYHIPALLKETIEFLDIKPDGVYVDATFGGGGHSRAILELLGNNGKLLGFDRDIDALANAPEDPRFIFVHGDFRFIPNFLDYYGIKKVDGILADLGVSFHHFDSAERGFSFRNDAPLDMRMNRGADITAEKLLNSLSEEQLFALLKNNTDLRNVGTIVKALLKGRADGGIKTTGQLTEIVKPHLNPKNYKKELAQVFQALRIATNDETTALEALLKNSLKVLKKGGRLAILTYHSGEDRLVKDFFKNGSLKPADTAANLIYGTPKSPWQPLTSKAIAPSEEEVAANPRARSAKLRVAKLK